MNKRNISIFSFKTGFLFIDFLIIFLLLIIFIFLQYKYNYPIELDRLPTIYEILSAHYKALILLIISWYIISDYIKLYSLKRLNYLREILKKIVYQIFFFSITIFVISGIKKDELFSNKLILLLSAYLFLYLFVSRVSLFFLTRYRFKKGINIKNILILGHNENSIRLKSILLNRKHFGYNVFEDTPESTFESFQEIIQQNNIEEIFLSQYDTKSNIYDSDVLNYCEDNHIKVNYIPYSLNNDLVSLEVKYIDTLPIFKIKKFPLEKSNNQFIKLFFDVFFSAFICVFILSWLFPILAMLIKIDSKGSVIFKQKRRGLNGEEFDCYKFRTMVDDGTNSIKATVLNDKRITKLGFFLRKMSIDELPQFINVLKGDMSIVGPRPHMISQDKYYSEIIKKYNLRNYVKPGITGLAQVKGFRGAIYCDKDMEGRIQTDIFYVRNWSILLDLQIIYQTIVLIFKGDKNAI